MQTKTKADTLVIKDGHIICPNCGRSTQYRVRPDTHGKNWPIWCKHCRKESIVNIEEPEPESRETSA